MESINIKSLLEICRYLTIKYFATELFLNRLVDIAPISQSDKYLVKMQISNQFNVWKEQQTEYQLKKERDNKNA